MQHELWYRRTGNVN